MPQEFWVISWQKPGIGDMIPGTNIDDSQLPVLPDNQQNAAAVDSPIHPLKRTQTD